ncbi:MAG TPA: tRNA pseudouridine(38-40) synthase TruA [Acidimicrobiales bacterium]
MSSSDSLGAAQRWRFDLAYDGRGFKGFAYQPHHDTVVSLLRTTLASTLGLQDEPVIVGAGRTDSGVHAFRQVVHVDLPIATKARSLEGERLVSSLNKQLRGRIQILSAQPVSENFHARFSATWREYRYLVLEDDAPGLNSTNDWAWTVKGPLDVAAMNRAAKSALGTHDFRAFCQRPAKSPPGEALVRRVIAAHWDRVDDEWAMSPRGGPAVRFSVRGQSFCHNMVRCLVSTMVAIGQNRLAPEEIARRLESGSRERLPQAAPAAGLALINVGYD